MSDGAVSLGAGRAGVWVRAGGVVGIAGVVLLFLAVAVQKVWSADMWWQLSVGRWIVEHGRVPLVDEFSWTARGRPEIEMRWVWCVLAYLAWGVGPWLLVLGQVAMLIGAWGMVAASAGRAAVRPAGLALIALGLAAGLHRWVARPELATYVLIPAFLLLLEGVAKGRLRRIGWMVPILQIVWTNTHTLFIMGPVLCWTFAGGDALQRIVGRLRGAGEPGWRGIVNWRLVAIAALATAACLVNPYFVRGALFTLEIMRQSGDESAVAQSIGEMRSPLAIPLERWTWDLWAGALLAAAAGATFVLNRRRLSLPRLAVFAGGLYLAYQAQRGLGMFALMGVWAGLRNLEEAGPLKLGRPEGMVRGLAGAAVGLASLGAAWYVATDRFAVNIGAPRETGFGAVLWNTPDGAVRFMDESGAAGPIFNVMRDGGYITWATRARVPVFIDGRTDVYGEAVLRELAAFTAGGWRAAADRRGINAMVVAVSGHEALAGAIARDPGWAAVFLDHRNIVFVRRIPENEAVIAEHRIDPAAEGAPREAEPDERPEPWKRAIGGPGRPWRSLGMAESFLAIGSYRNAAAYLRRGLEKWPRHKRMTATLAALEALAGRREEARRLYAELGGTPVWEAYSDRLLAELLSTEGRPLEAIEPLERVVEAEPGENHLRLVLADLLFQAGDFGRAIPHYRTLLGRGYGGAAEWLKLGAACEKTGDWAGAVEAYRASLRINPRQAQVENLLGMALGRRGDMQGAGAAFERALKINPGYEGARRNLEAVRGR